ncbi:hypothetical protein AgCh_015589 [Apium graveolens]
MKPADSEHSSSLKIWDYSDSESAPASSWSTIPNRTLLCRPLPVDIGRCTCVVPSTMLLKNWLIENYGFQPHAVSELNEKSFWKMFDTGLYEQYVRKYGAIS